MKKIIAIAVSLLAINSAFANVTKIIKPTLSAYYNQYRNLEHFSGIGFAVAIKNQPIESYYIGTTSRQPNSPPVNKNSLFQIGSITKSFTAVKILQLVAQGKLKLSGTIGQYLPQYKKWGNITIKQLLDMSSGLPNYSDSPTWNYLESKNIHRTWTMPRLIRFVYPKQPLNPPIKKGYAYTNTGYVLADMIIERVTHKPFKQLLTNDILKPLKLTNTFYPIPNIGTKNKKRLMHGYAYNQYDNPALLGRDMRANNLSWAAAAGGIVATAPQIVRWVQELFIRNKLLNQQQKQKLESLISTATGEAINKTTADDPKGFGLGVVQSYNPAIGRFWYYEGQTLGFRALYMYIPCNQIILAATVNSATNGENDQLHKLLQNTYVKILKQYPQYQCKS